MKIYGILRTIWIQNCNKIPALSEFKNRVLTITEQFIIKIINLPKTNKATKSYIKSLPQNKRTLQYYKYYKAIRFNSLQKKISLKISCRCLALLNSYQAVSNLADARFYRRARSINNCSINVSF